MSENADALAAADDLQAFVNRLNYVRPYMTAGEQAAFDVLTRYPYVAPVDAQPNLIVEFVVPHYFASLFASQYPDEHGGFGAQVTFRNEEDASEMVVGDVSFFENDSGAWLIEVRHEDGQVMLGTSIENVERILVV